MSQTETSFFSAERQVSVRGYNSVSEMYSFGKELGRLIRDGVYPVILYLGDHDPSGTCRWSQLATSRCTPEPKSRWCASR
jgi:hypothetical protein